VILERAGDDPFREEIAQLYHLPITSTETPRIKWLKSKEAAPPDNLPKQGFCCQSASVASCVDLHDR